MSTSWQLGRGREILETVADFFYFEDISDKVLAFCESRCESFQGPAHAQEQSLLNTEIFTAFCELFTGLIEGFLEESGIRISDFYAAVRNELDSVRGRASFSNIVMSTGEAWAGWGGVGWVDKTPLLPTYPTFPLLLLLFLFLTRTPTCPLNPLLLPSRLRALL